MNKDWTEVLQDILNKDVSSLTESDILFLKARSSYLTPEQLQTYASFFTQEPQQKKEDKLARYREVVKLAKERGMVVPKGSKLEDIEGLLNPTV
jgi:hypothetical protein